MSVGPGAPPSTTATTLGRSGALSSTRGCHPKRRICSTTRAAAGPSPSPSESRFTLGIRTSAWAKATRPVASIPPTRQGSPQAVTTITDVPGVRVGHWSDPEAATGCTVVLLPADGAVAGVDVRGPAPGTRETDLLEPGRLVEKVHAICLSGGSAFGLAAADGVMRFLRERGVGVQAGPARVPIVPAAVIFDLASGSSEAFPGPEEGYAACLDAEQV